jgi:hypothetical protein
LQFNDAGSFGGDAGLTFDKTSNALTIGAGSLKMTGSSSGTVTIQPAAAAGTYSLTLPTSDGDSGQFLKTDGSGVLSWDAPAVVTPGGSDTQVQFNDGGAFGADSGFTFNKTAKTLTLGGATVTASSPVLDLAQTWNNGAVTFTGLRFNATDTVSAAASLLMDLQVGGVSRFGFRKDGNLNIADSMKLFKVGSANSAGIVASTFAVQSTTSTNNNIGLDGTQLYMQSGGTVGWNSSTTNCFTAPPDTILTRRAAANLRLGAADAAAPVAQTLSVQSVVAGTTNTAGANLTITGSQGTGNAAGGSIVFQVAPAGSSGTAQNALATALTIDSAGTSTFTIATGTLIANFANEFAIRNNRIRITADNAISWSSLNNNINDGFDDLLLRRDAANTLALQNGTNAQTFRVYNTFTDASNYERGKIEWASNVLRIGTEKAGTGTARALELQTDGTTRLTIASTSGDVTTTGSVTTAAPAGGTAAAWKLGAVASVTPTLQNRTIEVDIGGTIYYIAAKTTND